MEKQLADDVARLGRRHTVLVGDLTALTRIHVALGDAHAARAAIRRAEAILSERGSIDVDLWRVVAREHLRLGAAKDAERAARASMAARSDELGRDQRDERSPNGTPLELREALLLQGRFDEACDASATTEASAVSALVLGRCLERQGGHAEEASVLRAYFDRFATPDEREEVTPLLASWERPPDAISSTGHACGCIAVGERAPAARLTSLALIALVVALATRRRARRRGHEPSTSGPR
jgi:hypothetical protein